MRSDPKRLFRIGLGALAVALLATVLSGCHHEENILLVEDGPPAIPTGVYTVTGDGWVEIGWNPVREDDVAGYGIYRGEAAEGAYYRIGDVRGMESDTFVDYNVANGETYYYAVDAYDFAGHESELSYELAQDTPRPEGRDVVVRAREYDPTQAGINFSQYGQPSFVTSYDAGDIFFHRINGVLYAKGTIIDSRPNDIQDLGFTVSMDEVSWAPAEGWSVSPMGVELIEGHTYVVWTWDLFFAKFQVRQIFADGGVPTGARIDWAYQIDNNNPELLAFFGGAEGLVKEGGKPR